MFAAAESGDLTGPELLFQLLRSNFKDDGIALSASVTLNFDAWENGQLLNVSRHGR
jgi:hypothetical protein